MKARTRTAVTTLALLAAVAAAVGIAFFGVEKPRRSEEARQESEEKVVVLDPARAAGIAVDAKGGTVKLARTAGQPWRVVAPFEAPADAVAVQSLLDAVAGLKRLSRVADPGTPLAAYGLEPPRARVTVSLEGGGEESVALGTDNPFDASLYVRAGSGGVDRVSGAARWSLEKDLFDLRDKRLLPIEEGAVTRLELRGKVPYVLAREGGGWRLVSPQADLADEAAVGRILGALRDLRATRFADAPGPDRDFGLDRPRWTVKVTDPSGERVLVVGVPPKKEPGVLYARVAGTLAVAAIPEGALSPVDADVLSLRDKSAVAFDPEQAAAVKVEAGSASIEVQKRPASDGGLPAWSLTAPRAAPALSWKVSGLLSGLTSLRATRFADETGAKAAAYGLDHPARVVTVLGAGGEALGKLEVGREEGEKTFVRGSRSPKILEVPTASLSQIPRSAEDLEEKPAAPASK